MGGEWLMDYGDHWSIGDGFWMGKIGGWVS